MIENLSAVTITFIDVDDLLVAKPETKSLNSAPSWIESDAAFVESRRRTEKRLQVTLGTVVEISTTLEAFPEE